MAPSSKPSFLKTFSDFTIAELRAMPLHRILSLFFREVGTTFANTSVAPSTKKKQSKKKTAKHILTAKVSPQNAHPFKDIHLPVSFASFKSSGFSQAMKRVFTPGPYPINIHIETRTVHEEETEKQKVSQTEKSADASQKETVVFDKPQSQPTSTVTH